MLQSEPIPSAPAYPWGKEFFDAFQKLGCLARATGLVEVPSANQRPFFTYNLPLINCGCGGVMKCTAVCMCTCGAHAYMVEAYEHIPLDLEDYVAHLKKPASFSAQSRLTL